MSDKPIAWAGASSNNFPNSSAAGFSRRENWLSIDEIKHAILRLQWSVLIQIESVHADDLLRAQKTRAHGAGQNSCCSYLMNQNG
jgi:hypothetical protein